MGHHWSFLQRLRLLFESLFWCGQQLTILLLYSDLLFATFTFNQCFIGSSSRLSFTLVFQFRLSFICLFIARLVHCFASPLLLNPLTLWSSYFLTLTQLILLSNWLFRLCLFLLLLFLGILGVWRPCTSSFSSNLLFDRIDFPHLITCQILRSISLIQPTPLWSNFILSLRIALTLWLFDICWRARVTTLLFMWSCSCS